MSARPGLPFVFSLAFAGSLACEPVPPDPIDVESEEEVCYDTFDNDEDDAIDCADSGCASLPTCCVGVGHAECCQAPVQVFTGSMVGCTTDVPTCIPQMGVFGEPDPVVVDDGMAAGDASFDNGAYLIEPLDPGGSILRIEFEAATASCTECVNYVAVGFLPRVPEFPTTLAQFPLAFALRPGYGDAALMLFGSSAGTWPLADDGYHRYAIEIRPAGTVTVLEIDAAGATIRELVPEFTFSLPDPAWLVVTGRSTGLAPEETPARVRSLMVTRGPCDMPQRALTEPTPAIASGSGADFPDIEGVGRAANGDGAEVVAIDVGDAFHLYRRNSDGEYEPTRALSDPIVTASRLPGVSATTIDDPWLVADEDARRWLLYFTVHTGRNASMIGRISSAAPFGTGFDYATFRVVAEAAPGFPKFEQPTVLDHIMIVRAANADLGFFVRMRQDGPDRWVPATPDVGASNIHQPDFGNLFAMDRDEVADPALVRVGGVYRLLFAGRRGTRWRVGLLVSLAGQNWYQPLGEEPVWELPPAGFDVLSARDPAPLFEGGRVSTLYVGSDGVRGAVGRATTGASATWP
jgi:hypothetical protein